MRPIFCERKITSIGQFHLFAAGRNSIIIIAFFLVALGRLLLVLEMEADEDDVDENKTKGSISRTAYEYAEVATTHGIYYIFEKGRLVFERVFWVIVVILALVFAIGLSIQAYSAWKENPVLTSVGTTGHPIEQVSFPSITVCPQGSANKVIDAALFQQFEKYLGSKNKNVFELSKDEIANEGIGFLKDRYPGAKTVPIQIARMLGSPGIDPDKNLETMSVLNPEDQMKCATGTPIISEAILNQSIADMAELNYFLCLSPDSNGTSTLANGLDSNSNNTNDTALDNHVIVNATDDCDENMNSSVSIEKLDMVFNPCMSSKKEQIKRKSRDEYQKNFGLLDLQNTFESLFELMWYSQLPCFDVANITSTFKDELSFVKRCYWKNTEMNCSSIFVARPTDRGMCCSFNSEKAEKVFRQGKYRDIISSLQDRDKSNSFDNSSMPSWYLNEEEPKTQPGQNKGLTIVLDAHTNKVSSGTISDNFKGFVTIVDGASNYPLTEINGFLVRPGRENHVALSALEIDGKKAIRNIPPKDRDCFFSDEHSLDEHQEYTQSNCVLECMMKYARKKMRENNETAADCTPWFYPVSDADILQFCDPWDTVKFQKLMASTPDGECSICLPDCTKTIFEAAVSTAPFRQCDHTNLGTSQLCDLDDVEINPPIWQQLVENEYEKSNDGIVPEFASATQTRMSNTRKYVASEEKQSQLVFRAKNNATPDYDAYINDIAIVSFYFDKSTVMVYEREERMTMIDYISQMGGLLGLGIGCSFISIIELLYWLTIRLARNLSNSKIT